GEPLPPRARPPPPPARPDAPPATPSPHYAEEKDNRSCKHAADSSAEPRADVRVFQRTRAFLFLRLGYQWTDRGLTARVSGVLPLTLRNLSLGRWRWEGDADARYIQTTPLH